MGDQIKRAYYATDTENEYGYLVFATSRGEAKSIAFGLEGLCYGDFTDIRVRREPKADSYAERFGPVAEWESVEAQRLLRSLGWYCGDSRKYCTECELGVFDLLPESQLDEDGVCAECRGETK